MLVEMSQRDLAGFLKVRVEHQKLWIQQHCVQGETLENANLDMD